MALLQDCGAPDRPENSRYSEQGASMAQATKTTIDPNEAAHFGALAADWWDRNGFERDAA
jgi:hypothetical protein